MTVTRLLTIAAAAGAVAAVAGECRPASAPANPGGRANVPASINVADYGAIGDGVNDNSAAFAAVAAAIPPSGDPVTVVFPPGKYVYAGGLDFRSPVRLTGRGARLDYRGGGIAVKLGPDGQSADADQADYSVDGLTFTGGAGMTHGIYFNSRVAQPRVTSVTFVDFGGGGAYAIWFQSHNRDARVDDVRFFSGDGVPRQFIRANGAAADGEGDLGQTRLSVANVLATTRGGGPAVGVYTSGLHSSITSSRIEGFSPGIQVGSNAGASPEFTQIDLVYLASGGGSPCIVYGEKDRASFTDHLAVERSFCDLRGGSAAFIGPAGPESRLRGAIVSRNALSRGAALLVVENDLPGQVGNVASLNFAAGSPIPFGLLHTAGAQIASWSGEAAPR